MTTRIILPMGTLAFLTAMTGCASNGDAPSSSGQTADSQVNVSLGTAVYGLSVRDCYAEASECLEQQGNEARTWVSQSLYCQSELRACLADVAVEAAGEVVAEARDVTQCGQDGLTCYTQTRGIQETLDCRNQVEVCVNDNVEDLTGIRLPTSREIVGAAVDAAEGVVERAVDRATQVVDTAVAVAEGAAQAAVDVAEAVTAPARQAIACTLEAQQCRFSFEDPRVCRREYQACLFGGLGQEGTSPPAPAAPSAPPVVLN